MLWLLRAAVSRIAIFVHCVFAVLSPSNANSAPFPTCRGRGGGGVTVGLRLRVRGRKEVRIPQTALDGIAEAL